VALDWEQKTGIPTWVGAWMPGNYNKGNEYTIPEQVIFSTFMVRELEKAKIPWAVNAVHHFYDDELKTWFNKILPLRDIILDPWKAAFYEGIEYSGKSIRLGTGEYDSLVLADYGLINNISSVMVPADMKITFFSQSGFSGEECVLTLTDSCLHSEGDIFKVLSLKIEEVVTSVRNERLLNLTDSFLLNNYPNPFNPSTHISFNMPYSGHISLRIFDITGKLVKIVLDGYVLQGQHELKWDGRNNFHQSVASGLYFVQLQAGNYIKSIKIILAR
jgi:hypothetical protein